MSSRNRYPGAKPFEQDQKELFFGREQDLVALQRKIKLAPLTVLYSKSGYGKSSLLNAGLIPALDTEGQYQSIRIRFNAYQASTTSASPLDTTLGAVENLTESQHLQSLGIKDNSIWRFNKEFYVENQGQKGLLLIFDQFEELFTYPEETIRQFRQQLAEALYTSAPQRYWDRLDELNDSGDVPLEKGALQLFQDSSNLKVVVAIRSDRMHLLEKLSDYIPLILKNLQELGPLDEQSAQQAIIYPAEIKGDYLAPRFSYTPEALDRILAFLTDEHTDAVESTQLQIICHHLEQKIAQTGAFEILPEDVTELAAVIENYYEERLGTIQDPDQVLAARQLIEEGLIFEEEERRLSIYEGQALKSFGLNPATLRSLVDSHLLRAEASLRGGYTYELSHDTLVPPILKAKRIRKKAEAALAKQKDQKEHEALLAAERRKRRRAYLLAAIGLALAAIATTAAIIAYRQYQQTQLLRFTQTVQKAQTYAEQGAFESASDLLQLGIDNAPTQSSGEIAELENLVDSWQSIAVLIKPVDSLIISNNILQAYQNLSQADSIKPYSILSEKMANLKVVLDDRVRRLIELAEGQVLIGQYDQARATYRQALLLDPENDMILNRLDSLVLLEK